MTNPAISIRSAGLQDINDLVCLLEQLFSIEKDFQFDEEKHKKGLFMMLDGCRKHKAVKVAVVKEAIVGMCTIQTRISTASGSISGVIEDLVIDKLFRGKGIGRALLLDMERWAIERGIHSLQLLADNKNKPALEFYARNNWNSTQLICLTRSP